jgi:phosphomannomutase
MHGRDPIRVYDARWEAEEFNDEQVKRLFEAAIAYGRSLGVDTITLARDARLAAGHVLEIGVETALRLGMRVYLRAEPISTPQSYFTTLHVSQEHPKTMGLTITASHNPAQYIGVKFTVPVVHAIGYDCGPQGGLTRVKQIYHSDERFAPVSGGSVKVIELSQEYIDFSLKAAGVGTGDLRGVGVVLDTFNGSAGPEIYRALEVAGVRIVARRLVPDGSFPTGSPNPTSQGKMDAAIKLAAEKHCDAVIGVDGDGDRIVFGDRRGLLTAGFVFVPILKACLAASKAKPGMPVLYDPKVSPLALAEWGNLGAKPVLFRNGHSQIKDYMTRIGALGAAEESGHYYHRIALGGLTISGENSILTILLFLEALARQPKLMDESWEHQDRVFTTGEFNYQFDSDATRDKALASVVEHFVKDGAQTVTATPDGIDLQGTCMARGVRLDPGAVRLDQGWYSGYLRIATNEKAVVRSYFSAGDTHSGKKVENEARQILEKQFSGKVID